MRKRVAVILAFAVITMGCGGKEGANAAGTGGGGGAGGSGAAGGSGGGEAPSNVPGKYVHKPVVEGIEREFIVYVPEKAAGDPKAPVVFMLHGTSGDGEKFYNISRWKEQADAEGLIAVFPSALTYCFYEDDDHNGSFELAERKLTTKWSGGKLGDPDVRPLCSSAELAGLPADKKALADHPLVDDVAFFDHMLDFLSESYSIDPKRTYASGFSNGAEMTSRLAAERSTRFAAIACASSAMSVDPAPAERPMSVILSIGELDDGFGALLGESPIPLTEALLTDNPTFANVMVKPFMTTLQLDATYTYSAPTLTGMKTSQFLFSKSTVGAANTFRAVIIEGLPHAYPNGTNHPIVMANVLWEFFKNETLP